MYVKIIINFNSQKILIYYQNQLETRPTGLMLTCYTLYNGSII